MDPRLVYIGDKKEATLLTGIERHFKIKRMLLKMPKEWVKIVPLFASATISPYLLTKMILYCQVLRFEKVYEHAVRCNHIAYAYQIHVRKSSRYKLKVSILFDSIKNDKTLCRFQNPFSNALLEKPLLS